MASLSRRHLLQLGAGASLALLAACRSGERSPQLLAARGTLPKAWLKLLPSPWESSATAAPRLWPDDTDSAVDLVAMGDGWLSSVAPSRLQDLDAPQLQQQLGAQAQRFLQQLGAERAMQVLPVGVSPWVMLFRNGSAWLEAARGGWDVLLDPTLAGRVVLPASPRFVIDLADRLGGEEVLRRLRAQLLTMDDRQATSWLLKGEARVVVLPLQRCMALLRRDPRLTAVLPDAGAPLHWTVLVRPGDTPEPLPQAWVEQAWRQPLHLTLLRDGWRSPLDALPAADELPLAWRDLLLPPQATWQRCWSLPPLQDDARSAWAERWRSSAP